MDAPYPVPQEGARGVKSLPPHTCMHAHTKYTGSGMCTLACLYVCVCMHACVCACMCTCVRYSQQQHSVYTGSLTLSWERI